MSSAYNLKIKFYGNGSAQVQVYSYPIGGSKSFDNLDLFDTENQENFIDNSIDNINRSLRRTKQKIIDYGRNNVWEWFLTFTFSPEKVDRTNYNDLSLKIRQWFNNQKRKPLNNNGKYLIVPELHSDGKSWHFHAVCSGFKFDMVPAINPKTNKILKSKGLIIYNVDNYNYGFTTATRIKDTKKAISYIVKYITKDLCTNLLGKQRYFISKNCDLPEEKNILIPMFSSESVEDIINKIKESNGLNITLKPKVINIDTGTYKNTITYYELDKQL